MTFTELKKNLKKDFSGCKKLKVALLGDSSTQFLAQAIRGSGYNQQLDIHVYNADYNQVDQQIYDYNSELYMFHPDVTIIFEASHKLLQKFNKTEVDARAALAENQLNRIIHLADTLEKNLKTKMIYFNYAEEDDGVFGNFANKVPSSFIYQQRKLNYLLAECAVKRGGFYVCDVAAIQSMLGRKLLFSPSIYINSDMVLSIDALPSVSESVVKMIASFQGLIKKCVILDLDNTIWGGVIGDDGIDKIQLGGLGVGKAFTEFQFWIKKLKERGIIVCICSKNTESVAKEPFEKHPAMILRLEDIAVFKANWNNKVDNIKSIQQILNIGFDSMVFIDDNAFERDIVRQNVPDITVPELPRDPAEYLEYLYTLNLFETASYSSQDMNRTQQYQREAERVLVQASFTNEDDFLESLNMLSDMKPFDSFSIPRVAQLSQRSNQFNLRTVRYTESEIERIAYSDHYVTFSFTLEDKYDDNGFICVLILEKQPFQKLFIDTWFMSCRVFKRGMESFVLNSIMEYAIDKNYQSIEGEYIPTVKNVLVKDLYPNLRFTQDGALWRLDVADFKPKRCFIKSKG